MDTLRYLVIENNNEQEKTEKNFEFDKEKALEYFETRCKELDKELIDWKKEVGINSCIWSYEKQFKVLYLQIDGHENLEF